VTGDRPRARIVTFLRRLWPWLVGLAILAAVATRAPLAEFRQALGRGPHLQLALVNVALNVAVLGSDSLATWVALIALQLRRPFRQVLVVRGATYLLFVVNYAVGQGGFGYYLYRSGVAALRATGITLFLIGTNLATLIVVTAAAWAIRGGDAAGAAMTWTLVASCAAFAIYLAIIARRPGFLAQRSVLAPLFDAGLRGHGVAMLGRLPHIAVIVLGHWVAMRAWGFDVPFAVGATVMPAVVIVSVLPLSPAGLGTTQAAFVVFFRDYAPGATDDQRAAAMLAFAVVHFVYGVLASASVGLVCAPFARRVARDSSPDAPPAAADHGAAR
jgi:hypothetical protein